MILEGIAEGIKRLLMIVGVLLAIFLVVGIVSAGEEGDTEDGSSFSISKAWATWDGEGEPPYAKVVVMTGDLLRNEYVQTMGNITGYAYNRTGSRLSYIQVSYGIYDENNNKLGSCLANESNISPDSGWKFEAICTNLPNSAFRYRVDEVTYW